MNSFLYGFDKRARGGEEGQAAQRPLNVKFQFMFQQHIGQAFFQGGFVGLGAKTEVEINGHFTWNDIGGASASLHVADLPAGWRKKFIAPIPHHACQFGQRRRGAVHRVVCQLRIGNVSLNALDDQFATE